jgi:hypothetical protein
MKGLEVFEAYRRAITIPKEDLQYNADGEAIIVLVETATLRVLLIRKQVHRTETVIEVECTLPLFQVISSEGISERTPEEQNRMARAIDLSISYLEWMKALHQGGFDVETLGPEAIWTAQFQGHRRLHRRFFDVFDALEHLL